VEDNSITTLSTLQEPASTTLQLFASTPFKKKLKLINLLIILTSLTSFYILLSKKGFINILITIRIK